MNTTIVVEAPTKEAVAIKALVLNHIEEIDKKKADLKNAREMLTNAKENDEGYRQAKETKDNAANDLKVISTKIEEMNPTATDKVDELKQELKDLQNGLNDYLAEFVRLTGKMELTTHDGRELKIVRRFKTISPGQQKLF